MYEQEDSCIEQEDLMTEYMVYPKYENKILFRVAPSFGGIGRRQESSSFLARLCFFL